MCVCNVNLLNAIYAMQLTILLSNIFSVHIKTILFDLHRYIGDKTRPLEFILVGTKDSHIMLVHKP